MKDADEATNLRADISIVTEPSAEVLNERQQIDYPSQREQCLDWQLVFGKDPKQADGYAHTTVKCRRDRMDQFYRWVWSEENGYTTVICSFVLIGGARLSGPAVNSIVSGMLLS